jgi:hypothetical protein
MLKEIKNIVLRFPHRGHGQYSYALANIANGDFGLITTYGDRFAISINSAQKCKYNEE